MIGFWRESSIVYREIRIGKFCLCIKRLSKLSWIDTDSISSLRNDRYVVDDVDYDPANPTADGG